MDAQMINASRIPRSALHTVSVFIQVGIFNSVIVRLIHILLLPVTALHDGGFYSIIVL